MWYNGGETDMKPSDFLDMDEVRKAEEDFGKVNAIIRLNIPDYQIGEEVSIYFKDTMMVKGVVEKEILCEDAVSRQSVIDAIEDDNRNGHYSCFASNNDAQCFKQIIKELPKVTSVACIAKVEFDGDKLKEIVNNAITDMFVEEDADHIDTDWLTDNNVMSVKER